MAKDHKNMQRQAGTIRVIVFQDEGLWVAQCLEYDICAQAADLDTLMSRLEVVIKAELKESLERHREPFGGIEPAPDRFQRMWDRRARSVGVSAPAWMVNAMRPIDLALV